MRLTVTPAARSAVVSLGVITLSPSLALARSLELLIRGSRAPGFARHHGPLKMPTVRTRNSTTRRLELADFLDNFRDIMVQKCSSCA